jgi:hypothetical protein
MQFEQTHLSYLTRYAYLMMACFIIVLIIGLYAEYDVQGFTYNLPMLVAFASGVYFYREYHSSPMAILFHVPTVALVVAMNGGFFALMLHLFIEPKADFSPETVFVVMQVYALVGLGLSRIYFSFFIKKHNESQTSKTAKVLNKASKANKKARDAERRTK